MTVWEGEKSPVHGSNKSLSFANVMDNDVGDRDNAGDSDAQASGGRPSRCDATKTRRCYYCKNRET